MQFSEIQPLIDGINDRERGAWERMRLHAFLVAKMMGDKQHNDVQEFMPFGWEQDPDDTFEPDEQYIAEMQAKIREWNKQPNKTQS